MTENINVMLEKEFQFYLDNQEKLLKDYEGKFIVIIGNEVKGAYNSELEAFTESKKLFKSGTFLIQKCTVGEDDYTETFHSRVVFG